MNMTQMTMFGVRGERFQVRARSPLGRAVRAETMPWGCLDCGHKWRDLKECGPVARAGCPKCGSRNIIDFNASPAGSPPCDGCMKVGVSNCLACIEKGETK